MIKLNQPYKCRHCGKPYVILLGYGKFKSYLPVEIINETEIFDYSFDKHKHVSHLKNCPQLQAQWEDVKEKLDAQFREKEKAHMKDLLK